MGKRGGKRRKENEKKYRQKRGNSAHSQLREQLLYNRKYI
jgi:hypothetical protein